VTEPLEGRTPIVRLLEDAASLLKNPQFAIDFGRRGINTSVALIAIQGVVAYLRGDKARAVEDLSTAVDEIRARGERGPW
jgi:hypothetical protein